MNYTKNRQQLYSRVIKMKGKANQLGMLQEEATELAQASLNLALITRKILRKGEEKDLLNEFASEIADVEILMEQARILLGPKFDKKVNKEKEFKLHRLSQRLEQEENL
jgi:NTP pyrophosphatase (non-canonical NTP hydrolase)